MSDWLKSVGDWRKVGATFSGVVSIMTAIVLFAPDTFVVRTGLLEIRSENLAWIGLAFLISISIFLATLIEALWKWIREKVKNRALERNLAHTLSDLTVDQKELLRELMTGAQSTVYRPISNGTASYLASLNVILRTSNLSNHGGSFPYGLQPWAKRALKKNPSLLD